MDRILPQTTQNTNFTSYYNYDGLDLSLAAGYWKKKARSDCRLILMKKLLDMGIGFNELEHFNEALHLKIRSETLRKRLKEGKNTERKVVREAMLLKIRDEQCTNKETNTEMQGERRALKTKFGENTRRARGIMKYLNEIARGERNEMHSKYSEKIKTLKLRHLTDIDTKTNIVPPEISDFKETKVFSKEKFDNLKETEIKIVRVGELSLNDEEEMILKKHPKSALLENLKIEDLELDFEIGFGKYRYHIEVEGKQIVTRH